MELKSKIYVTGHRGLVGSALVRLLRKQGHEHIITATHDDIDLTDPVATKWFFSCHEPDYVFHCAARVGGLKDNINNPISMFVENLQIQNNVLLTAAEFKTKKLLFLGSSCIYPMDAPRPLQEESLLTGPFQPEVEPYGLAKVCGIRLGQYLRKARKLNFISALPCNLFGIGDDFDCQTGHVVPGMMHRMHNAKIRGDEKFSVWGNPYASRELLFADDLAAALVMLMDKYDSPQPINVGSGCDWPMNSIAQRIAKVVGYTGEIVFDETQPVGTAHKRMDNSKMRKLGWPQFTGLDDALKLTYSDFLSR